MSDTDIKFSFILKNLMKIHGLTYKSLSEETGIPQSTLKDYVNNIGSNPRNMSHIRILAKTFKVSLEYLLWGEEELDSEITLDHILTKTVLESWVKIKIELPETSPIIDRFQTTKKRGKK